MQWLLWRIPYTRGKPREEKLCAYIDGQPDTCSKVTEMCKRDAGITYAEGGWNVQEGGRKVEGR